MKRVLSETKLQAYCLYMLEAEKSSATVEKYLRDLRRFIQFAAGRQISKNITLEYKNHLQSSGYAVRSVNSMLAAVNGLMDYLGWTDCKVKNLRCQRQIYCEESKELTKDDYLRLLKASGSQPQLNLVLQTICATGIRVSELKYFTVEAVQRGEVSVQCKNKTRRVLVPGKLRKALLAYAGRRKLREGAIFVTRTGKHLDRSNIWSAMKRLCQLAGVAASKVFPHNLRKLFARTFYGIEKDIAKLADILGHGSIETTRIYIMSTGAEHRRQLERLGLVI